MTATSFGPKKQPKFAAGDAPDLSGNPTEVAEYAAAFGNYMTGTTAERNLATSWAWEGLQFFDTTEKKLYIFSLGAWKYLPRTQSDYVSRGTNTNGDIFVAHSLGEKPTAVHVTGGIGGVIPTRRTYAVHAMSATQFTVRVYRQDFDGGPMSQNPVDFYWTAFL